MSSDVRFHSSLDLLHQEMRDLSNIDRKALPLTSPCFGDAETSLSLRKVAQRQGEVTLPAPCAFLNYFQCSKSNSPSPSFEGQP